MRQHKVAAIGGKASTQDVTNAVCAAIATPAEHP